jgi:hypothetical protein
MNIAREWKRIHKKEPDAFYYCGVLELLKALQNNNNKLLASAKENLDKCFHIYKEMKDPPPPKKFVRTEFLIGREEGLRGLIIYDDSVETDLSRLLEFQGELENNQGRTFINYKGLNFKYLDRNAINENNKIREVEKDQRKKYQFYGCINRSSLLMYKFKAI